MLTFSRPILRMLPGNNPALRLLTKLSSLALISGLCFADEVLLGHISVKPENSENITHAVLRLKSRFAVIFGEMLDRDGLLHTKLTQRAAENLLKSNHLVLAEDTSSDSKQYAQWEFENPIKGENSLLMGSVVWKNTLATSGQDSLTFRLLLRSGKAPESGLSVDDLDQKQFLVKHTGTPLLQYNYGIVPETPGKSGSYDRAGYLHPVWTPTGKIVTGDFSPEHIHQRGIFLAWRSVRFGDIESNFWELGSMTGRMLPSGKTPVIHSGPIFTKLTFSNLGFVANQPMFREQVELRIYAGHFEGGWIFDMRTQQLPISGKPPMELKKMYYGGMSFRGPSTWLKEQSREVVRAKSRGMSFGKTKFLPSNSKLDIITSEGKDRMSGDRTTASWIDYTGPLDSAWGGIAMFDHPSNLRYPTPLRIHPELPYFSWAMAQREPHTVTHEKPLDLIYRVWVHDGRSKPDACAFIAAQYLDPPKITWRAINDLPGN